MLSLELQRTCGLWSKGALFSAVKLYLMHGYVLYTYRGVPRGAGRYIMIVSFCIYMRSVGLAGRLRVNPDGLITRQYKDN